MSLAYWARQGGYVDIPARPEKGDPELVFTPGFSGCTLVVDKKDDTTLRVWHVQGGKEDEEYNDVPRGEHGLGMINAMEYSDYGYHEAGGAVLKNITGTAFLKYENGAWHIKYQRIINSPNVSRSTTVTAFRTTKPNSFHVEYTRGHTAVQAATIPLRH